jgi:tRNA uridine 5-carboxymethylaminomethyl modification enzyme
MLRRTEVKIEDFLKLGWITENDPEILEQLEIQAKYEGYINNSRNK